VFRNITVYCSSSSKVAAGYYAAARDLGLAIADAGWGLVYGGNNIGMMGALADAVRAGKGKVVGVTPRNFVDQGIADPYCDELIIANTIRHRKEIMESRGDAFIAMPGGLGTFEEIFEIIVGRYLDLHRKPVIILNIARYYDPLLAMIDHGIEHGFIRRPPAHLDWFVADSVETAVEYLKQYPSEESGQLSANPD
jgi:hypothetical protein